jgi:hypothetical protein
MIHRLTGRREWGDVLVRLAKGNETSAKGNEILAKGIEIIGKSKFSNERRHKKKTVIFFSIPSQGYSFV